ncbi:MAG: hypothetical protein IJV62_02150 [Eggerthellaceae bacterium]|nr:hypothetical protein [Eggerthellaceae bacterium]
MTDKVQKENESELPEIQEHGMSKRSSIFVVVGIIIAALLTLAIGLAGITLLKDMISQAAYISPGQ